MKRIIFAAALCAAAGITAADDHIDYSYVELGAQRIDTRFGDDDRFFGELSIELGDTFYLTANGSGGGDADLTLYQGALGFRLPIGDIIDLDIRGGVIRAEVGSFDLSTPFAEGGVRTRLLSNFELGGYLVYYTDDSESDMRAYTMFHLNENLALIGRLSTNDDFETYGAGLRISF